MLPGNGAMGIDSCTSLSWSASHRRVNLTPARLRLKEERKRIIRALDAKYRTIDDHERGMLRFVLIRNNLRRLQREAREEKLARHRNNLSGSKVSNLSPSCLSSTRSRSPSPPLDYGYGDSISSTYGSPGFPLFGDDPPAKKQRLLFDDDNDKENEMDVDYQSSGGDEDSKSQENSSPCKPVDDAQEILRDLYETCINEGITEISSSNTFSSSESSYPTQQTTYSFSVSASCSVSSSINSSSSNQICNSNSSNSCNTSSSDSCSDWPRHSQYPFNCGQSSLLGNDLQSVVFHSLITSLES